MPDENPVPWRVVSQRESTDVTPGGEFRAVMDVVIETASGTTFTISVPVREYSAERVASEASLRATEIEVVNRLGSG